ncbi:MAG: tRNA (guanine-N2)-dimethyltransferase, partial [Gemmatimonadetes bacterium]|nr:RNA methyltransferase [Gemmatimonadota bacterium]NIT88227.1 RNA methyltransferase [Gemmatimonadota bacterium]NIU32035.1 RNA methyltransferase [Gemmatimonadota bacterium]NIU36644.1 tRNA (guanine-N2)-dimethyltransferase [Gemmatimonadota bacterium]NIV62406.1 tRNA (guanine-N2)-dimethyltransferase [Gemmatimonadota bacterium]
MTADRIDRIREVLDRRQPDLTVLMEKVHKPHNFSAILRTCDAVGVLETHAVPPEDGLSLHESVAKGAARWVRVRRHDSVEEAATHLRDHGSRIVAAHPSETAVDFRTLDYTGPTAFLVGTELYGLSDRAVELA